ncbi:MAG: hypothetical protein IT428_00845 [Planctomycetaceae bacterium]|nr:hypothetical protein [Planctomycetaceae bacterium]
MSTSSVSCCVPVNVRIDPSDRWRFENLLCHLGRRKFATMIGMGWVW